MTTNQPLAMPGAHRLRELMAGRAVILALLALIALFVLLRFLLLSADFPLGLTPSGTPYTDEGYYANAALRQVLFGHWFFPGDFNPAVSMPLGQVMHWVMFVFLGPSLVSTRLPIALAASGTIILMAMLLRRSAGVMAGLVCALLLSTDFVFFAFSRISILEPMGLFFVTLGLVLAQCPDDRRPMPALAGAGLSMVAALLVKTSMVFGFAPLAVFAWHNGKTLRQRALSLLVTVILPVCCFIVYGLIARSHYPADYNYFTHINLEARWPPSPAAWLVNILHEIWRIRKIGWGWVGCFLLLGGSAWILVPAFWRRPLVQAMAACAAVIFCEYSITLTGPPHYMLVFFLPTAGLLAIACVDLTHWLGNHARYGNLVWLPGVIVAVLVSVNAFYIARYMAHPRYSFLSMAKSVGAIVAEREGHVKGVELLGHFSGSVALVTGVRAINTYYGTSPIAERLAKFRPRYALIPIPAKGPNQDLDAVLAAGGKVTVLGHWTVFQNYYYGGDTYLYAIAWPGGATHRTKTDTRHVR